MPALTMDKPISGESTNNPNQDIDHTSPSPCIEDEAQTACPIEPTKYESHQSKLPQELLDLIWDAALAPWLKKRVIALDYIHVKDDPSFSTFELVCESPQVPEVGKLARSIRLVDTRARNAVSRSLTRADRNMFPESRDYSRTHLHSSFKHQYADFGHDIFWLSRGFIDARFLYLSPPPSSGPAGDGPSRDAPQPSHMMLSLRHMLAIMEMTFTCDTPCLGRRQQERRELQHDSLRDFHSLLQIGSETTRLRILTALLPQSIDEWLGKVDYEGLEHRPFGTSVEEKESVLGLARNESNRQMLEKVHTYWSNLTHLAEQRGVDLPTLHFSRRQS